MNKYKRKLDIKGMYVQLIYLISELITPQRQLTLMSGGKCGNRTI